MNGRPGAGDRRLDETDEFSRSIFEALAEGVLVVDHEGRGVAVDASALALLGFTRDRLVGHDVRACGWTLCDESGHEIVPERWPITRSLVDGHPSGGLVISTRPNGDQRTIVMIAMPLPRPSGRRWTVVSLMDVTREREAELALAASEQRFRVLVEQAPDPVLVLDARGAIRLCNEQTAAVFGYDGSALHALSIDTLVADAVDALRTGARALHAAMVGRRRDGSEFPLELSVGPIDALDDLAFIVIVRDLTERQHAQELATIDRAKSEFLSRMSHELRTPLNSVLGFAQLLAVSDPRPDQRESVDQILRAGRHLLDLLNDLLEFERARSGHITFSLEPVSVVDVLDDALGLIEPSASERSVTTRRHGSDDVWAIADAQRLRQVVLNLLSNAVKYNRSGGHVDVWCGATADGVVIAVADTGVGIAADRIPQLFVPFERLGADQSSGIDGAGVGLALSKTLVQGMRGSIEVESEQAVGSTFRVHLRRATRPGVPVARVADAAARARHPAFAASRVLYIEDSEANVEVMRAMLRALGVGRLDVAYTGRDGIAAATREPPDAILLDLHLPDLGGADVVATLRRQPATAAVPVLAVTADANPTSIRRMRDAGVRAYLTKPVDLDALRTTLEAAIAPF